MRTSVFDLDCGLSNESPKHFGAFTPACSRIYLWSTVITKCVVRGKARCKQRSTRRKGRNAFSQVLFHTTINHVTISTDWTPEQRFVSAEFRLNCGRVQLQALLTPQTTMKHEMRGWKSRALKNKQQEASYHFRVAHKMTLVTGIKLGGVVVFAH